MIGDGVALPIHRVIIEDLNDSVKSEQRPKGNIREKAVCTCGREIFSVRNSCI